jgi:hypothetical protein
MHLNCDIINNLRAFCWILLHLYQLFIKIICRKMVIRSMATIGPICEFFIVFQNS